MAGASYLYHRGLARKYYEDAIGYTTPVESLTGGEPVRNPPSPMDAQEIQRRLALYEASKKQPVVITKRMWLEAFAYVLTTTLEFLTQYDNGDFATSMADATPAVVKAAKKLLAANHGTPDAGRFQQWKLRAALLRMPPFNLNEKNLEKVDAAISHLVNVDKLLIRTEHRFKGSRELSPGYIVSKSSIWK